MGIAQNVIFGLITGSYIAIAAVGFTLIYGLINMINFAYGEYITIGGYVGFVLASVADLQIPLVIVLAVPLTAVIGWTLSRAFFTPIRETGPIPLLLTSIGLGLILRNGVRMVAGAKRRFFEFQQATVFQFDVLGGLQFNTSSLSVFAVAVAVFVLVHVLLTRTRTGIAMRAMGDDETLAEVAGIDTSTIRSRVWLLASGLAGLAGVLLGVQNSVGPFLGYDQLLVVLAAAVLGGAGSAYGAIVGAYILGIAMALTVGILPTWASEFGTTVAFVVLIGVLLVRPEGIAGKEVRRA
ncbi:branched-chain amino acid ABC transporter permease [Haloferax sp. MBLA0076]|uniref:Branched-chain amino acid ABC transporter permease n=1 Tax=Haloferax litoreum TaxID=2666140 RepID=A0A6A8GJU8_9EURY|nr:MULTISPECIES: branched-chain amino acid ABC transporter permease [Haloferax]KAB1190562.1 branched-chain amino acid ABC transporter permease [Haloferax sp. CBA1148]MRX23548.1 branched-chain amino acid ABC transporter permease [Haloferax litoreum]